MKQRRLKDRRTSLYSFEKDIIQSINKGWVRVISANKFQLAFNPWVDSSIVSNVVYVTEIPHELHHNDFISVESELRKYGIGDKHPSLHPVKYEEYKLVTNIEKIKPKIFKPRYIDLKDFSHEITTGWIKPEDDDLDQTFALHAISSPPMMVKVGGIGSIAMRNKGTMWDLEGIEPTLRSILPEELCKANAHSFIGFPESYEKYQFYREKISSGYSEELSYDYPTTKLRRDRSFIISIPILISNSKFLAAPEIDEPDYFEFLMNARINEPEISDRSEKLLRDYMIEISQVENTRFARFNINIDQFSLHRIALAKARLEYKSELEEQTIKESYTYVKKAFDDFYVYLKNNNFDFYRGDRYRYGDEDDAEENLPIKTRKIWEAIIANEEWVKKGVIFEEFVIVLQDRFSYEEINQAIERLNSVGLIIYYDKGRRIKPVR